jgi:predicted Zn-dependent protease
MNIVWMSGLKRVLVLCGAIALVGCAPGTGIGDLGNSLLNAGGFGGSMDVNKLLGAGNQLASAARGLDEQQEYYLGRGVSAVILSKYPLYQNAKMTRYLNQVGQSIARFSDRPEIWGGYRFAILDTREVNAISAPGGFVFISRGFLKVIPNEDALAAVLAHEIGHIVKGHGTAAISQSNLTQALTTIGREVAASEGGAVTQVVTQAFGDSIEEVTNTLLTKGYSRSQEYDADEYAAELLKRVGYNQTGLVEMLTALEGVPGGDAAGGWFTTHPNANKRVANIEDEILKPDAETLAGEKIRTARFKAGLN